jgi:hypothetical protein
VIVGDGRCGVAGEIDGEKKGTFELMDQKMRKLAEIVPNIAIYNE